MKVQVCVWKACKDKFSEYILTRLESDKKFYNLHNTIVEKCPCTWNCKTWPSVVMDWHIEKYMNPAKASKVMIDKKNNKTNKKTKK